MKVKFEVPDESMKVIDQKDDRKVVVLPKKKWYNYNINNYGRYKKHHIITPKDFRSSA